MLEKFTGTAWSQNALNLDYIRNGEGEPQETPHSFYYQDNPVREKSNYHTDLLINKVNASYYNRTGESENLNSTTISQTVDAIGSTEAILYLKRGTWDITDSLIIPENIVVEFAKGAILSISEDKTVTFNGHIKAYGSQIFAGAGSVAFGIKSNSIICPEWWGANPSNSEDDTVAIQAAINSIGSGYGKILQLSEGTYYVSTLTITNDAIEMTIAGLGKGITRIIKYGTSTDPIFNIATGSLTEWFGGGIRDLRIDGITTCAGIKITNMFGFEFRDLDIRFCLYGIESLGSLVYTLNNCHIQGNSYGMYMTSNGGVCANDIHINNSNFSFNTQLGIYYNHGSLLNINQCNFGENGTEDDDNTGAIFIANGVDDEIGYSTVNIEKCWFEGNWMNSIFTDTGGIGGLSLAVRNCNNFLNTHYPKGKDIWIKSGIRRFILENTVIGGGGTGVVNISSTLYSYINNCIIDNITDTSTYKTYYNCQFSGADYSNSHGFVSELHTNGWAWNQNTFSMGGYKFWTSTDGYFMRKAGTPVSDIDGTNVGAIAASTYNGLHPVWGNYHLWIDGSGNLRIKNGAPSTDTDGTIVGTQA